MYRAFRRFLGRNISMHMHRRAESVAQVKFRVQTVFNMLRLQSRTGKLEETSWRGGESARIGRESYPVDRIHGRSIGLISGRRSSN